MCLARIRGGVGLFPVSEDFRNGTELARGGWGEYSSIAMTNKQQSFVREYLVDLNATQAAIRAKYSKKTAYSIGLELNHVPN